MSQPKANPTDLITKSDFIAFRSPFGPGKLHDKFLKKKNRIRFAGRSGMISKIYNFYPERVFIKSASIDFETTAGFSSIPALLNKRQPMGSGVFVLIEQPFPVQRE